MVEWRDAKIPRSDAHAALWLRCLRRRSRLQNHQCTAIFRLQEHTDRLFNSAKILRMKLPFTKEEVNEAQKAVVRENNLESGYIRPLTWIGSKSWGVSPKGNTIHLMVAAWTWGAYLGEEGMKRAFASKLLASHATTSTSP